MSTQTPETLETFETLNTEAVPAEAVMPEVAMPEVVVPTYASMPEFDALPEAPVSTKANKAKTNKKWFVRIFAFLLSLAFIAIYCLVPITHLKSDGTYKFEQTNYLAHMLGLFTSPMEGADKLFGILPTHFTDVNGSVINQAITIIMYLLPVALVVCFFFGLVALCSKRAASYCLRFIAGTQFVFSALLLIAMVLVAAWFDGGDISWKHGLDPVLVGIAGGTFLIYVIASIVKAKGWAVLDLFIFLLTATSVSAIAYGIVNDNTAAITKMFLETNEIYNSLTLIMIAADIFFLICALIGISAKKLYGIDLVRAIFMTAVGGFLVFLSFTVKTDAYSLESLLLPSIIAAGSAFLMLIIEIIAISARNSKAKKAKAKKAVAVEEPNETFVVIDTPVAPIAPVAEETVVEEAEATIFEESEEEVTDPFLLTLTKEEKEHFGALTVKLQKLPDIPKFEAGADNKVFFRRIFVNLGTLREMIPDELMEKIYQFTIQL